jgi:C4-dicarboxylate transporter, DctQ subunit
MARFAALYRLGLFALARVAGAIVFAIFVLIVADVLMRTAGLQPWAYTTVLVEYGLMWFTMLAAPWLVRTKGHVYIDAVTQLAPPRMRRVLARLSHLISVATCGTFFVYALRRFLATFASGEIDSRGEDIAIWLLFLPMAVGFLLVTIEFGRYLVGIDSMYGDRTEVREGM